MFWYYKFRTLNSAQGNKDYTQFVDNVSGFDGILKQIHVFSVVFFWPYLSSIIYYQNILLGSLNYGNIFLKIW